jgi:hypothetical protein
MLSELILDIYNTKATISSLETIQNREDLEQTPRQNPLKSTEVRLITGIRRPLHPRCFAGCLRRQLA